MMGERATAMLGELSHEWTLAELAARAATSRATLRSFCRIANVAPLTFLTELRLAFARRRLAWSRSRRACFPLTRMREAVRARPLS